MQGFLALSVIGQLVRAASRVMSTATSKDRRAVFKGLAALFAVLGIWWGGGTLLSLIQGFAEHEEYHKQEFEEALPMLSLLTAMGMTFLLVAWIFWRAARRAAKHKHDHAA
jgi:hypothetical protein